MSVRFCDKATDFENELVVQCDVSTVKNTSLVGSGSDNWSKVSIGTFITLFLGLLLCNVLVS